MTTPISHHIDEIRADTTALERGLAKARDAVKAFSEAERPPFVRPFTCGKIPVTQEWLDDHVPFVVALNAFMDRWVRENLDLPRPRTRIVRTEPDWFESKERYGNR